MEIQGKLPDGLALLHLATTIGHGVETLYLMWTATNEKIEEMLEHPWMDPTLSHRENKHRMKQLGGAAFSYRGKLSELTILGMAKLIEDVLNDIHDDTGIKLNFWDPGLTLRHHDTAIMVRCLANVIKHHRSLIVYGSCPDADRLIDEFGFSDVFAIDDWRIGVPEGVEKDLVVVLYHLDWFLRDLVSHALGIESPGDELPRDKIPAYMRGRCLPEALFPDTEDGT